MRPIPTDATRGATGPRPSRREKMTSSRVIPKAARARNETTAPQMRETPFNVSTSATTITMLLMTSPPRAYWSMMVPNANASPPRIATPITRTIAARRSSRRKRRVGRSAAHLERAGDSDAETWAMVPSDTRGTTGASLTFCGMGEKSYSRGVFARVVQPDRLVLLEPTGAKHLIVLDEDIVTIPGVGVARAEGLRALVGRRWTVGGRSFLVLTPTVRDMVASMRRQAQIVGLKDAATLVWNCDLKAGDFVVEAGAGSGALTLVLAQAVGPNGRVVTYDLRPDFLDVARTNVANAGLGRRVEFRLGDVRSEIGRA